MNRAVVCAVLILTATVANARKEIVNIENAPVPEGLSLAQVQNAITTAAVDRKWVPKVLASGRLEATLPIRSHVAVVDIKFDESTYSITYKESTNLDYKAGKIHRNYNRWVANLDLALQRSLLRVASEPAAQSATTAPGAGPADSAAARGTYSGETVTIPSSIDLSTSVNVPPAFRKCGIETQLPSMLEDQTPLVDIGTVPSDVHYMDLAITDLHMPSGSQMA